ncbi:MAG: heme lyase CcmF/NrfE family subunit [Magnetococcales bacterium]|nr:heme lyase CcmF/NrfE family subunit [Magnetococcales bacterium]
MGNGIEIGHFAALTALLVTLVQVFAALYGAQSRQPRWIRVARNSSFAACGLLTISSALLVAAFLNLDFSVLYVVKHASRDMPVFYLATAMWGGHEGSLLLWAWLLSLFIALAVWKHWKSHPVSMPWVMAISGALLIGFLLLVLFLSSPFERMIPARMDGRGLNPLLQDPGMALHPPFLYLGYVGFVVPYAFGMAALITGRVGEEWILATRRWALFAWGMLTTGIIFGANWAYYELGWGGYWAWDPVENASFMPWLTATAYMHSVMVQERTGTFKTWNLFLIITTFALSLLGTFLVRSGVLSSIHAFANDPGRGVYILIFMSILLIFSFGWLVKRGDALSTPVKMESFFCRESAFLFNNLFLLVAMITVLLGTLYPLAVETLSDAKVSVGAPYYNKVFVPLMLGLLLLMGIGPVIPWRRAGGRIFRTAFTIPLVVAIVLGIGIVLLFDVDHPYGVISVFLILFVAGALFKDFVMRIRQRRARESSTGTFAALFHLVRRNKRRYGGMITHLGILLMVMGFIGSGIFQEERNLLMEPGDTVSIGEWTLDLEAIEPVTGENWIATEARFNAQKGALSVLLKTQKRTYNEHSNPTTESAIHTSLMEDIYVVLGDEAGKGLWGVRIYRNPLVIWVWIGSLVMGVGVLLGLFEKRRLGSRR